MNNFPPNLQDLVAKEVGKYIIRVAISTSSYLDEIRQHLSEITEACWVTMVEPGLQHDIQIGEFSLVKYDVGNGQLTVCK